jgi:hypothetical protein
MPIPNNLAERDSRRLWIVNQLKQYDTQPNHELDDMIKIIIDYLQKVQPDSPLMERQIKMALEDISRKHPRNQ